MHGISSEYVGLNWKNVDIVKFYFENALHASNTPQGGVNRVKQDEDGFWKILHSSDIVEANTQCLNKEQAWIAK